MNQRYRKIVGAVLAVAIVTTLSACSGSGGDGKVTLQFLQNKSESIAVVNKLIKEFEKAHPNIQVVQSSPPDAVTALRADITKNKIPDVITVNVNSYNDIAKANILTDQAGTAARKAVDNQGAIDYTNEVGQTGKTVYALPWTVNAQVVLYNKDQFAKLGLSVPNTWDEFISTAQKIAAANQVPFQFTWKDDWTAVLLLNSLAGPTQPKSLWDDLKKGSATFAGTEAYQVAAKRMVQLKKFAQADPFGSTYDTGNTAFANGKSPMYIQGTWAIPVIAGLNPSMKIGMFALPTGDSASQNRLVGGPESVVGVAKGGAHTKEAQEFVDFLFTRSAQKTYADDQHLFSVRKDVAPSDPELAALKAQWIDTNKMVPFATLMFGGASQLGPLTQAFLNNEDVPKYLKAVDADWQQNGIK